jgi:hypothetical protein
MADAACGLLRQAKGLASPLTQKGRLTDVSPDCAFGRSRPAADASREAVQRWLLDGLDVSVGHRRCSRDPSSKNDAGGTPAS